MIDYAIHKLFYYCSRNYCYIVLLCIRPVPLTCRSFPNLVSISIAFDTFFLLFMAYIFAAYTLLMTGYLSSASINLILVYPLIKQRCVILFCINFRCVYLLRSTVVFWTHTSMGPVGQV